METLVVEAFHTKYGPSFLVGGVWHTADKKTMPNLTCKAGDTVEVERNGKWVKSFRVVSSGTPPERPTMPQEPRKGGSEVQGQICRGNACNAILGSPSVAEMVKGRDFSESFDLVTKMITKTANYIQSGEWK